jgi:hypothetical protein
MKYLVEICGAIPKYFINMTAAKNSIWFFLSLVGFACTQQTVPNNRGATITKVQKNGFRYCKTLEEIFQNPNIAAARYLKEPLYEHIYTEARKNFAQKRYQLTVDYGGFAPIYFENIHLVQTDSVLKKWELSIQSGQHKNPSQKDRVYKDTDFAIAPMGSVADKVYLESHSFLKKTNYTIGVAFTHLQKIEIEPIIVQKFANFLDSCASKAENYGSYMDYPDWHILGYESGCFANINFTNVSEADEKIIRAYIYLILKAANIKNKLLLKEWEKYATDIY